MQHRPSASSVPLQHLLSASMTLAVPLHTPQASSVALSQHCPLRSTRGPAGTWQWCHQHGRPCVGVLNRAAPSAGDVTGVVLPHSSLLPLQHACIRSLRAQVAYGDALMPQQRGLIQPMPLQPAAMCAPWQQVPLISRATPSGQATVMLGQPAPGGGGGAGLQLAARAGAHCTPVSSGLGGGQLLSFRALPVKLLTHWTSLHGVHGDRVRGCPGAVPAA